MDHALLVRVLHCATHRDEKLDSFGDGQPVRVAIVGDREPTHELH